MITNTSLLSSNSILVAGSSNYTNNISTNLVFDCNGSADFKKDVNIDGDLKVNGRSILDSLKAIESKLGILVPEPLAPDPILLQKYEELRELKRQYEEMEAQFKTLHVVGS